MTTNIVQRRMWKLHDLQTVSTCLLNDSAFSIITRLADDIYLFIERQHVLDPDSQTLNTAHWADTGSVTNVTKWQHCFCSVTNITR